MNAELTGRFRKKPIVIEAFRLGEAWPDWWADAVSVLLVQTYNLDGRTYGGPDRAKIRTLEGVMTAEKGDWIIRGVKGEIYPCKPDIFAMTYEPDGAPRVVNSSAPGRNEMLAFAADLCERVRDEYRRLQVGLAAEGAQACCDHIRLRIENIPPEEGRSLSKPHPSDVCGWCGFRFGKHSVVGDACPLPPASKEGSWTWDSRTFKPEVVPPKENSHG